VDIVLVKKNILVGRSRNLLSTRHSRWRSGRHINEKNHSPYSTTDFEGGEAINTKKGMAEFIKKCKMIASVNIVCF
jgi:hypothetical protein